MVSPVSVVSPNGIPQVGPVVHHSPAFRAQAVENYGPKEVRDFPDRTEYVYETEGSTGKKWGVGIASAVCPGFGQAINGQWGKGFAFLAGWLGSQIIGGVTKNLGISLLGTLGIGIWSIVDAVNSAKSTETVILPKVSQQKQAPVAQAPQGVNYQA